MKLVYKGKYTGEEQLPKGKLPPDATPFKEPETPAKLNLAASAFLLPAYLIAAAVVFASIRYRGYFNLLPGAPTLAGTLCAFLTILPHELLHGLCFGRDAEVELYVSPKNLMAFVTCVQPISKGRFIFLSLLPNLVFGYLPLLIWAFAPMRPSLGGGLFMFSMICISFGVGDYLNAFNAARQMPKGSVQQLSGFHSYWYMP